MGTKAKLTVVLKADDTVVAESEDAALWQNVLSAIHGAAPFQSKAPKLLEAAQTQDDLEEVGDKYIASFAKRIGVSIETLVGALSPSREAPYLQLDPHCWAYMKKNTPQRGAGSLSATGLAGTLLALWLKEAKLDAQPTQALASDVLGTINVRDPNASRGIKNTRWLQGRSGGVIVINPAELLKAIEVARAFCSKDWTGASKAA